MLIGELKYKDTGMMPVTDDGGEPFMDGEDFVFVEFYGPDSLEQERAHNKQRRGLIEAGDDDDMVKDVRCQFFADITKKFHGIKIKRDDVVVDAMQEDAKIIFLGHSRIRDLAFIFVANNINFMREHGAN